MRNINVLQAGQTIEFKDGVFVVRDEYLYNNTSFHKEMDERSLMDALWSLEITVFKDVIKSTKGKNIVVPLSGGLDSRFVASMLKLLGVKDVVCINYGIKESPETRISKLVAEKLDYGWHNIDYSLELQVKMYREQCFWNYIEITHGFHVTPNIQEFLSTSYFKEKIGIKNAVFIPGHTGDFISGGHITREMILSKTLNDMALAILKYHYIRHWPLPEKVLNIMKKYLTALLAKIKDQKIRNWQVCEMFDWRERQAKFIMSAIKPYEFFGYQWLIPLWDERFIDFWASIPLKLKIHKKLYRKFLSTYIFGPLDIDFEKREKIGSNWRLLKSKITYKCSTFNPCGFDRSFPLFDIYVKRNFPSSRAVIEQFKRANGILNYGKNPNSHLADAVATIILDRFHSSSDGLVHYSH
ncbi:MAG: asparagine synthase C-terminal domain-containing protein [Candidatus Bathyarchaeia archaeon]